MARTTCKKMSTDLCFSSPSPRPSRPTCGRSRRATPRAPPASPPTRRRRPAGSSAGAAGSCRRRPRRADGQERCVEVTLPCTRIVSVCLVCMFHPPNHCHHSHTHKNTHRAGSDSIVSLGGPSLLSRRLQNPLPLRPDQLLLQILKTTTKQLVYHKLTMYVI